MLESNLRSRSRVRFKQASLKILKLGTNVGWPSWSIFWDSFRLAASSSNSVDSGMKCLQLWSLGSGIPLVTFIDF